MFLPSFVLVIYYSYIKVNISILIYTDLRCSAVDCPLGGVLSCDVCVQFQSGGAPKAGTVVSAQEAQAQAILQQTKVHKLKKMLLYLKTHLH